MKPARTSPLLTTQLNTTYFNQLRLKLREAEQQAITGKAILKPSDAPSRWTEIHAFDEAVQDQGVWQENAEKALTQLDTADATLDLVGNTLKRAWELGVQMASETNDAQARAAAGREVDNLRARVLELANTKVANRYVFAGSAYDGPAFDGAGTYLGANDTSEIRVGTEGGVVVGWDGAEVFQGGVDVFQLLEDLSADMLADDPDAVATRLTDIQDSISQVVGWRQEIGFRLQQAQEAVQITSTMNVLLNERLGETVAADPAEAYTRLAELRTTYEATLQIGAGSLSLNLFDYIR